MILMEPAVLERYNSSALPREINLTHLLDRHMKLLHERDRLLLEMALKLRLSRRQIGAALGLSPGNVSRRLRRLVNRLHDPLVTRLCDPKCPLADEYRQIGLAHFLHDLTIAELARTHRISEPQARGMIEYIRGWHRGLMTRR